MKALVTTVIPTYRRPHLLKGAIYSALNQTIPNIEVCIWDNASQDETASVVKEIAEKDSRVKYYCHSKQIAPSDNFQFGISSVKTPFFSILADDDLLAPDFYEIALASMSQFPRSMFFWGSTIDVKSNGKVVSANASFWEETKMYEPPEGLYNVIDNYFNWTGALFRSEIQNKVRLDSQVKPIDLDFILRLSAQFPFVISRKPCALFIHHKQSYSTLSGLKLVWPSWLKILQNLESIQSLSLNQKTEVNKLMFNALSKKLFSISIALLAAKEFKQSKEVLSVCLNEFPRHVETKILSKILPHIEKNLLVYWFFRIALELYRFQKCMGLQRKYGKFSKELIRQYHYPKNGA